VLHEPWKVGGVVRVEAARVDLAGGTLDDIGAAVRRVAAGSVEVVGIEIAKNAGAVQKVMPNVSIAIITAPGEPSATGLTPLAGRALRLSFGATWRESGHNAVRSDALYCRAGSGGMPR
jgi:hypothetical protein